MRNNFDRLPKRNGQFDAVNRRFEAAPSRMPLTRRLITGCALLGADRRGAVAAEFVLIMPTLALMMFGILNFGLNISNRLVLTDATRSAARELAVGRESNTVYADALSRFNSAAPTLSQSKLSVSFKVGNTVCTTNEACKTLLATAGSATTPAGRAATVSATYSCNGWILAWEVIPGCAMTAETAERVE